jgi:hypothetical protein
MTQLTNLNFGIELDILVDNLMVFFVTTCISNLDLYDS